MHLLLRCLADLPSDRPPLAELEWLMKRMEGSGGLAILDEDVLAWCDMIFHEPAPVSDFLLLPYSPCLACSVLYCFLLLVEATLVDIKTQPPSSSEEASAAFETANSAQRPEVFATAASQGGAGNDRVALPPPEPRPGWDDGDDYDAEFNAVPLGGESFVIPDTPAPAPGASWAVVSQ